MPDNLTASALAQQIGEAVERILEWRSVGLLEADPDETFPRRNVPRAALVRLLRQRDVPLAAIVDAERETQLVTRYADLVLEGRPGATVSLQEAAARLGLDVELVKRFREAAGVAERSDVLYEPDVQALRGFKLALDAGLPEDALFQLLRVYADGLGRVAEAESRLFHFYVHQRLKTDGVSGAELTRSVRASSDAVMPLVEPTLLYFHRRAWERVAREDAVLHAREYAGLEEQSDVLGQVRIGVAFVDLSSFTSLADVMGDEMAAGVLERFSRLVRDAARRFDGRVVKQIGDAFMLVFPEATSAVACALAMERATAAEHRFPALRTGIHYGPALYREGDYLGTTINVAARLAAAAEPHRVLLSAAVQAELGPDVAADLVPLGKRRLKGIAEEVELFQIVPRPEAPGAPRLLDPVCGMELRSEQAAARLTVEGQQYVFCSQQCLQRFVATPERYTRA